MHPRRSHGCCPIRVTGVLLPFGRYLYSPLTVLRYATQLSSSILYTVQPISLYHIYDGREGSLMPLSVFLVRVGNSSVNTYEYNWSYDKARGNCTTNLEHYISLPFSKRIKFDYFQKCPWQLSPVDMSVLKSARTHLLIEHYFSPLSLSVSNKS